MHQKKSEVQIGKESSGVSSDFNPTPPLIYHQKHLQFLLQHQNQQQQFKIPTLEITIPDDDHPQNDPLSPLPYKRPNYSNPLSKSPSLYRLTHTHNLNSTSRRQQQSPLFVSFSVKSAGVVRFLRRHVRRGVRIHLRVILLLSLPFFYFVVSNPTQSFILDFLSAFAFSAALLVSLNLALPRLPSMRLFLARSFPIKQLTSNSKTDANSSSHLPVIWSIGSRPRAEEKKQPSSGCAVQVYSNGDVYEGEFHKGNCSGSGVYYYYMSGRYEGDWVDGKYDGYGIETWARGSRYRGQYNQGLRHGFGVYRFYTGDVYAGEWSNGQSHGCGVHTCEDGSRYVGEFKWGVKHGIGHYQFRNGDTYAGEYFADKMHGFGVYRFANGHHYEGAWHEGRRQGLGMYTFSNGETQSGHWQNGILNVPSTQSTTYPVAVYHSKVLNAVQEARRGADKVYDVGKVDERVNRAVTVANRAANAARVASVKAVQKQIHYTSNKENTLPITSLKSWNQHINT